MDPTDLTFQIDDPTRDDVRGLLETHLDFARLVTPPGHVHALDVDGLLGDGVNLFSLRNGGELVAIGALRRLDDQHVEVKSMHTAAAHRGQGAGRAIIDSLLAEARRLGYRRVSLETGTMEAFRPARTLYRSVGFTECPPFASYTLNDNSVCMTRDLD